VTVEGGTAFIVTSSPIAEGTVLMSLTSAASRSAGSSSACPARMSLPPQLRGRKISKTERSKQIEVDARTPDNSSGEKTALAHSSRVAVLWCSMATPLGRPVEPEV
jgi:hypothetical protein